MAIDLQNPQNIATGWKPPEMFHAPEIGGLVGNILRNRMSQQELQQKEIADAIRQYQSQKSDAAYIQAAQNAGVLPQGDYSGMNAKEASDLAQRIQDMTPDTDVDALHQAMARYYNAGADAGGRGGRGGSGVPRYDYHGVLLTGAEYQRKLDQDAVAHDIGKLSAQEAEAQGKISGYQAKYGVDPENSASGGLKGNPSPADVADYLHWNQEAARIRKQKENYKWFRGTVQPPSDTGGGTDEEDDGSTAPPPPQTSGTPLPDINKGTAQLGPDAQARIQAAGGLPSPTPRPGAPPPADSAAGHTSTYGTPAPGGNAQTGDLVPGQSRRYVGGKWWTWDGSQWQPE